MNGLRFYVGLHQPADARHFDRACISVNRLRHRRGGFTVNEWIMDSGAFTEISTYGRYRHSVGEYADEIRRWANCGRLVSAVAQDMMCEPFILKRTGLTIHAHQEITISRYDDLVASESGVYIMPVLQGYAPGDYVRHVHAYGDRLLQGAWVGVGSVCKRNSSPVDVAAILDAINHTRPDLRLHGFGVKKTALCDATVQNHLYSADSMAWSFSARRQGRNGNDWREAAAFVRDITEMPAAHSGWQPSLRLEPTE